MFQLCYVSTSASSENDILMDLRDILGEARDFNVQHDITGVLYFADKYFFQCLEGDEDAIRLLYEKLKTDKRHYELRNFQPKTIQTAHFSKWAMKYVNRSGDVHDYFKSLGLDGFQPYELKDEEIDHFLVKLYELNADQV